VKLKSTVACPCTKGKASGKIVSGKGGGVACAHGARLSQRQHLASPVSPQKFHAAMSGEAAAGEDTRAPFKTSNHRPTFLKKNYTKPTVLVSYWV
jgi:hypothetical protein